MPKLPEPTARALKRIGEVHSALMVRGFKRLGAGPCGLGAYDVIESWMFQSFIVYLLYRNDTGDHTILTSVSDAGPVDTWRALDVMLST